MTFAVPCVIGLPLVVVPLLARLGNKEIASGGTLVPFLIAAGVMLWGVSAMLSQMFYGAKRTMAVGIVTVAGAVLNLILNLLLVPAFGIKGSAVSTLLAYFLTCVTLYFFCERSSRIEFYWLHIVKCLAAGLLMAGVVRLITTALPGALPLAIVAGVAVYLVSLWLVRAVTPSEIQLVKGMVRPAMAKQ
jgi:O-antigen/teichoic acid export membrane protein